MHRWCETCKVGAYGSAFDQHMAGKKHAAAAARVRATSHVRRLPTGGFGGGVGGAAQPTRACFAFQRGQCCTSSCTYRHVLPAARNPLRPGAQQVTAPALQKRKRNANCGVCGGDGEWCSDCGGGGADSPPQNPDRAPCFAYRDSGRCPKGASCTFAHPRPGANVNVAAASVPASATAAVVGRGSGLTPQQREAIEWNKAAAQMRRRSSAGAAAAATPSQAQRHIAVATAAAAPAACEACDFTLLRPPPVPSELPAGLRGILKRTQLVSLSVRNEEVMFQPGKYNGTVIAAIKEMVPNRSYSPADKSWRAPVESLPAAVALFEHMGRAADASVKQRAAAITAAGADCPRIKLALQLELTPEALAASVDDISLGKVTVGFDYDADIVAAIKSLPPWQRAYHPPTRTWPVELLALPALLEALAPLCTGAPSARLQAVAAACTQLSRLIFSTSTPVVDVPAASGGDDAGATIAAAAAAGDDGVELQRVLKELLGGLRSERRAQQLQGGMQRSRVDRSDCGVGPKQRRLTDQQVLWGSGLAGGGGGMYEDMYDDMVDLGPAYLPALLSRSRAATTARAPPADCDCGRPDERIGGRHCCKYFGTFRCGGPGGCGNGWTSANTWKGEGQDCRKCGNKNVMPESTRPLERGLGVGGNSNGPHDFARCSMCRRLGYDCSGRGGW